MHMIIEQKCIVPIAIAPLWDFMVDAPAVSRCMPGVEEFSITGVDEYQGKVRVKVGPISLLLEGRVTVDERDQDRWTARVTAEGRDVRIVGGIVAKLTVCLTQKDEVETELSVLTNATVLGKLGEFGQPIMRKSADRIMQQFVQNVVEAIGNGNVEPL